MSGYICSTCRKPIEYKNLTAGQCKDCNDDFHPSSIDMIEEILHLKSTNQLLEQRLKEAEEVIRFYGEPINHEYLNDGNWNTCVTKDGGKLAREYLAKYGEKEGV